VHRALDARHRVEHLRLELALVADGADQRSTAAISASPASGCMTMIMSGSLKKIGRPFGAARFDLKLDDSNYRRARPRESIPK
jgi:hypothetical protein